MNTIAEQFRCAFGQEAIYADREYRRSLYYTSSRIVGQLVLRSGKLYIGDPPLSGFKELTQEFPPSTYPIILGEVFDLGGPMRETSAVAIQLSPTPIKEEEITEWECALGYSEEGKAYGVGIDSASLAFCDAEFATMLKEEANSKGIYEISELSEQLKVQLNEQEYAELPAQKDKANLFLFMTGRDGVYPVYIGYNALRQPLTIVVFITDVKNYVTWDAFEGEYPLYPQQGGDAAFYQWIKDITFTIRANIVNHFPCNTNFIQQLSAGTDIPDEIASYYRHCTPWAEKVQEPLKAWECMLKNIEALAVGEKQQSDYTRVDYTRYKYYLPIWIEDDEGNGTVAGIRDHDNYQVFSFSRGYDRTNSIKEWYLYNVLTVYR